MTPEDQRRIIVAKDDRRIRVLSEPRRFTLMPERRHIVIDDLGRLTLQGWLRNKLRNIAEVSSLIMQEK